MRISFYRDLGFSIYVSVFMFVDFMEIKRFVIDKELVFRDSYSANFYRESVEVRYGFSFCLCSEFYL